MNGGRLVSGVSKQTLAGLANTFGVKRGPTLSEPFNQDNISRRGKAVGRDFAVA